MDLGRAFRSFLELSRGRAVGKPEAQIQTLSTVPIRLLAGYMVPVVGESFYAKEFAQLLKLRNSSTEIPAELKWATLELDPLNPHSPSRKAVKVSINGRQVGHIAEKIAPIVYDSLESIGGYAECECWIYFDEKNVDRKFNSVALSMTIPLVPEQENNLERIKSPALGIHSWPMGLLQIKQETQMLSALSENDSLHTSINIEFEDKVWITTVDGLRIGQLIKCPDWLHNLEEERIIAYVDCRILKTAKGLEVIAFSDSEFKLVLTRTGDCMSPKGSVLSNRYHLALEPDLVNWVKLKPSHQNKRISKDSFASHFLGPMGYQYFWSSLQDEYVSSARGLRGEFYERDLEKMRRWLGFTGSVSILCRAKVDETGLVREISMNFSADGQLGLIPYRPIVPPKTHKLTSKKGDLRVVEKQTFVEIPKETTIQEQPKITNLILLPDLKNGEVLFSGLDYLQEVYLLRAYRQIGINIGDGFSANKTRLLVVGPDFKSESSAKARKAHDKGLPIITVENFNSLLHSVIDSNNEYQALARYVQWLSLNGENFPFKWGYALSKSLEINGDLMLIPGGALDERVFSQDLKFLGNLNHNPESKETIRKLFESVGGQPLDTLILRANGLYSDASGKKRLNFECNGLVLGSAPADSSSLVFISAKLEKSFSTWVKLQWVSRSRFVSSFEFL